MATILIIDDDLDLAAATAARLRREGHDADWVSRVPAAMTRLRQQRPDLILLDIGMPEFSGLEMLQALGDDPRYQDLRVVVLSGSTDAQAPAAALRLGACDFIPKTLGWNEIVARIRDALDRDCSIA
jgi:two-component system KDP operon response regulator KdpE